MEDIAEDSCREGTTVVGMMMFSLSSFGTLLMYPVGYAFKPRSSSSHVSRFDRCSAHHKFVARHHRSSGAAKCKIIEVRPMSVSCRHKPTMIAPRLPLPAKTNREGTTQGKTAGHGMETQSRHPVPSRSLPPSQGVVRRFLQSR